MLISDQKHFKAYQKHFKAGKFEYPCAEIWYINAPTFNGRKGLSGL